MSEDISHLQRQLALLHQERHRTHQEQRNLEQQIHALVEDNKGLQEQLNQIMEFNPNDSLKGSYSFGRNTLRQEDTVRQSQEDILNGHQFRKAFNEHRQIEGKQEKKVEGTEKGEMERVRKGEKKTQQVGVGINQLPFPSIPDENTMKEQHSRISDEQRIRQLESQNQILRRENHKLYEVNNSIIRNLTHLRKGQWGLPIQKEPSLNIKEQLQLLAEETQHLTKSKSQLNYRSRSRENTLEQQLQNQDLKVRDRLQSRERQFTSREQEWEAQCNLLNNQIRDLKRELDKSRSPQEQWSDTRGGERSMPSPMGRQTALKNERQGHLFQPYKPMSHRTSNPRNDFEGSKEQSRSEVETIKELTSKLENELRTSEEIYNCLVNNTVQKTPRVESRYTVQKTDFEGPFSQTHKAQSLGGCQNSQEYYRWLSLQDRIRLLNRENEMLRRRQLSES